MTSRSASNVSGKPAASPGAAWPGALGVSPKQIYRWRKGVEPSGGALHSLYLFADEIPGGVAILMGKDRRTTCCQH